MKIRQYREQMNMTQEQLAQAAGVTQGAVWQWERGLSVPRPAMLLKLATIFGVTIEQLIKEDDGSCK